MRICGWGGVVNLWKKGSEKKEDVFLHPVLSRIVMKRQRDFSLRILKACLPCAFFKYPSDEQMLEASLPVFLGHNPDRDLCRRVSRKPKPDRFVDLKKQLLSIMKNTEKLTEKALRSILNFLFAQNMDDTRKDASVLGTPVCIWGPHGIGKTEMVADLARENGWQFAYCAPGQFEEMGDFHGMPVIEEGADGVKRTRTAPPEWVPTQEGPGILLLDDINRADDRILRGIMQLLQNHRMGSWRLPSQWQIVATANPDGGSYSVTSMDEAMLTRMLHFTMRFDPKVWAEWATQKGVDARGIAFVLAYPEAVSGKRTTARTLTQFFSKIRKIEDLRKDLQLVRQIGSACLDSETVRAFTAFVADDLSLLPTPEEILGASPEQRKKWKASVVEAAQGKDGIKRVDRLSAIVFRVVLHLNQPDSEVTDGMVENFIELFTMQEIPRDLGIGQIPELMESAKGGLKRLLARPKVRAALGNQFTDDLLAIRAA
jgi:MoxR-like ATPase